MALRDFASWSAAAADPEKKPSACGSACGAPGKTDKPAACGAGGQPDKKPSACGSACGAPRKPSACGADGK